jgi:hypothetical protein
VSRHLGEYVAIHNSQVVDHDIDIRALHLRIRHRFGRMPVLIRQVTQSAEARDLVFHSPKADLSDEVIIGRNVLNRLHLVLNEPTLHSEIVGF